MQIFILPIIFLTLLAWGVFGYIVWFVPPEIGGKLITINLLYFFVSGWIAIAGTASLIIYFASYLFTYEKVKPEQKFLNKPRQIFRISLRRGALLASALTAIGFLRINDVDNTFNVALLVLIALLIEVYFSSK